MTGSTYVPQLWAEVPAIYVQPMAIGVTGNGSAGTVITKEYVLTDDVLIRGVECMVDNPSFGDTVTIQVTLGDDTLLSCPVNAWNISTIQKMISYQSLTPQKGLATFKVKVIYNSVGLSGTVNFGINFLFLKLLK